MIQVAARALRSDAERARMFLLEVVRARQRVRKILPRGSVEEAIERARATLEHALPDGPDGPTGKELHEAIELFASKDLQRVDRHFSAAACPDWLGHLHGRLRLLALPVSFIERAATYGIGSAQLFALKRALDDGLERKTVEDVLQRAHTLDAKQLAEELGLETRNPNQPEVQRVLEQFRRLPRLLRRRISKEPDPDVLERLFALLEEVEKVLDE